MVRVLGIETSCDETSIAILQKSNNQIEILAAHIFSQVELLTKWGGVVPEISARNHLEKIAPLLEQTFDDCKLSPAQIDLISVTAYPGLLGPLLTGIGAAKTLALLHQKPIYRCNHLYAHIEAIHLTETVNYPYLGLVISGGHTLWLRVNSACDFQVLGSTIDDAIGETLDKAGKLLGLGYPAGAKIDALAKAGDPDRFYFPIPIIADQSIKISYSGLKTALRNFVNKHQEQIHEPTFLNDVCASFQKAVMKNLILKTQNAIHECKSMGLSDLTLVVGGGVACNSYLREEMQKTFSHVLFVNPLYCSDNAIMIANLALRDQLNITPFPQCLNIDAQSRYINKKSHEITGT